MATIITSISTCVGSPRSSAMPTISTAMPKSCFSYSPARRRCALLPDWKSCTREDLLFFEAGESGAHRLRNRTDEPCTYLDMRSYIGYDICEYPDSDKIILVPGGETFRRSEQHSYFEGETSGDKIRKESRR